MQIQNQYEVSITNFIYTKLSRFLSLILRHKPDVIRITLDEHGWADVKELLALEQVTPREYLYHGTGRKYETSIDEQGLVKKTDILIIFQKMVSG